MMRSNEEVRTKLLKDVEMAIVANFSTRLKELLDVLQFEHCNLPQKRKIISRILMSKWMHCHRERAAAISSYIRRYEF